jgi:hypothetical protein
MEYWGFLSTNELFCSRDRTFGREAALSAISTDGRVKEPASAVKRWLRMKIFFANGVLFDVVVKVLMTIGWISKHNLLWNVIPNHDG